MLVNVIVACTSTLEELWARGFASGSISIDCIVNWTIGIDASPRKRVSYPGATNKHIYIETTKLLQIIEQQSYYLM